MGGCCPWSRQLPPAIIESRTFSRGWSGRRRRAWVPGSGPPPQRPGPLAPSPRSARVTPTPSSRPRPGVHRGSTPSPPPSAPPTPIQWPSPPRSPAPAPTAARADTAVSPACTAGDSTPNRRAAASAVSAPGLASPTAATPTPGPFRKRTAQNPVNLDGSRAPFDLHRRWVTHRRVRGPVHLPGQSPGNAGTRWIGRWMACRTLSGELGRRWRSVRRVRSGRECRARVVVPEVLGKHPDVDAAVEQGVRKWRSLSGLIGAVMPAAWV